MSRRREAAPHSPASGPTSSSVERQQQIAQRAYELYLVRDCRHGRDLDDWLDAEREIATASLSRERALPTHLRRSLIQDEIRHNHSLGSKKSPENAPI